MTMGSGWLTCNDNKDGRVEVGVGQEIQVVRRRNLDVSTNTDDHEAGCTNPDHDFRYDKTQFTQNSKKI